MRTECCVSAAQISSHGGDTPGVSTEPFPGCGSVRCDEVSGKNNCEQFLKIIIMAGMAVV